MIILCPSAFIPLLPITTWVRRTRAQEWCSQGDVVYVTCCSREIQCNQIVALRFDIALSGGEGERERERERIPLWGKRAQKPQQSMALEFRFFWTLQISSLSLYNLLFRKQFSIQIQINIDTHPLRIRTHRCRGVKCRDYRRSWNGRYHCSRDAHRSIQIEVSHLLSCFPPSLSSSSSSKVYINFTTVSTREWKSL